MTREITADELVALRTDGQFSRLYLAIPTPLTVLTARVSTAPASNNQVAQVGIDNVVGTLTDVMEGMTVYVGSQAGAWDKGTCRVRKAPISGTLYIGETSDIAWGSDDYLTVVADYRLWPRNLVRVGETGVYMDWDIAYTDQHTYPAPVVNMGPDVAAWIDPATLDVAIDFDASDSFVLWGTIDAWLWECDTADSIVDGTTAAPQMVFTAAGVHDVRCTATTNYGATHTGHRTVCVFDSANPPITQFSLDGAPGGSFGGGWKFEVTLYAEAGIELVPPGAKVILFARDWYALTALDAPVEGSLGPVTGRENILAVGRITDESITVDPDTGDVSFSVTGLDEQMQNTPAFATGLMDTDFADGGGGYPNRWVEMIDLTPRRACWHLLHWRSTASIFADIYLTDDTRQTAELSAAGSDLWSQLQELTEATILAQPSVDRYGALHVAVNQAYLPEADRASIPTVMAIESQDWTELSIVRRSRPEYTQVRVSGATYSVGVNVPMGAISPGATPAEEGKGEQELSELVMGTQAQALELAGTIAGAGAAEIEQLEITLAMNNRFFDVAPWQFAEITLAEADTVRGAPVGTYLLIPREVRFDYDDEKGYLKTILTCDCDGDTWPAIPMTFPGSTEPPVEPPVEPPPTEPPPPPPGPPPPPPEPDPDDDPPDAIVALSGDVLTTADFDVASPAWDTELGSGPTAIVDADLARDGSAYYALEDSSIWKSTNFASAGAATWSEVETAASLAGSGGRFLAIRCSQQHTALIYALAVCDGGLTYCGRSNDGGTTWAWSEVGTQTGKDYTVTYRSVPWSSYGGYWYVSQATHERIGDDVAAYNPIAMAFQLTTGTGYAGRYSIDTAAVMVNDFNWETGFGSYPTELRQFGNSLLAGGYNDPAAVAALEDYFGGTANPINVFGGSPMPEDAARVIVEVVSTVDYSKCESWVFWGKPSFPQALAVSPTNDSFVYIGTQDGIYKSTDGGFTWTSLTTDYGANDLLVDPAAAGVVYFWSTAGKLGYFEVDAEVFIQDTGADVTETPENTPQRIGRWGNRLWVITGGAIKRKLLGVWSTQKSSMNGARGIKTYTNTGATGRLVFVESTAIWYSDDGGATWADKTGDIASMSGALVGHLLP